MKDLNQKHPNYLLLYRPIFIIVIIFIGGQSLFQLMGWDQLNFHYIAYKINHWHLLPYRDAYEFQFYGIFLYHLLIQKLFGYSDMGFRIFDFLNFVFLCLTIGYTLKYLIEEIDDEDLYLILILLTATYYSLGGWWTGQREIFIMPYIFWSFYFFKKACLNSNIKYAFIAGIAAGIGFIIKPFGGVYLPIFVLINLLFNYPYPQNFKIRLNLTCMANHHV